MVLNEKGFLNYEHWRPIEGEDVGKHLGELRLMMEFGKMILMDVRIRKLEVLNRLDISFKGYRDVYGIPEHADRLSLKETRGGD